MSRRSELVGERECAHCGRPFVAAAGTGRPRKYCRRSCRQRAFEVRRHEGDLAWGDRRIVAMARELAALEDAVDRVRVAVDELRADVEDDRPVDARAVLDHLDAALSAPHTAGRREGPVSGPSMPPGRHPMT